MKSKRCSAKFAIRNQRYQHFTQAVLDKSAQASLQIAQDTNRAITANRRAIWTHAHRIMPCTSLLIACFLLRGA